MAEEFIDDIIAEESPDESNVIETAVDKPTDGVADKSDDSKSAEDKTEIENNAGSGEQNDPVKELAAKLGWREDHQGDDAVDAQTYILKSKDIQKSMGKHNKDLKDQLQVLNSSVSALKKHNEKVYQVEVKKLTTEVDSLKAERRAAIELADVDKVDELDKQIDEKQKDLNEPQPVDQGATDNPAYDEWVKDNKWYLEDNEMAAFADTVAQQYTGAPLDRVYNIVREKVKEVFPEKFNVTKDGQADKLPVGPKSPVEGSSTKISEGTFSKADLSSEQVQIMKQFVSGGIMTEDQYINDIAKMQ